MINIYEEVKEAKTIGISGHIKPDGDCIGSCLGLFLYLRKRVPDSNIVLYLEEASWIFKDIPGFKNIKQTFKKDQHFDAYISIDTVPERMGAATEKYNEAEKKINIDHHITNPEGKGDCNYVVPGASSASELVYNLIPEEYLDKDIAEALYMGIAHDTGVFRHSNVQPSTLRAAAKLLEFDFDASKMLDTTFFEKTIEQNKAQGAIVIGSRMYYQKRLIIGSADEAFMEENHVKKADFEGVVNQLLLTKGVGVAVFMYVKSPGLLKISMRSKTDRFDVAKVSALFSGGGHVRAAGCDYEGTIEEAEKAIVEAFKDVIK